MRATMTNMTVQQWLALFRELFSTTKCEKICKSVKFKWSKRQVHFKGKLRIKILKQEVFLWELKKIFYLGSFFKFSHNDSKTIKIGHFCLGSMFTAQITGTDWLRKTNNFSWFPVNYFKILMCLSVCLSVYLSVRISVCLPFRLSKFLRKKSASSGRFDERCCHFWIVKKKGDGLNNSERLPYFNCFRFGNDFENKIVEIGLVS